METKAISDPGSDEILNRYTGNQNVYRILQVVLYHSS